MRMNGFASRAEVTDAAMSERAECVMLNKGAHVCQAVGVLDDILECMQSTCDQEAVDAARAEGRRTIFEPRATLRKIGGCDSRWMHLRLHVHQVRRQIDHGLTSPRAARVSGLPCPRQ